MTTETTATKPDVPSPPYQRLGITPKIATREDAELALQEMGWLEAIKDVQIAHHEAKLRELNEAHQRALQIDVAGEAVPIEKRWETVSQALLTWADANRDVLLDGDAKTIKLRNGTLKWRNVKDAVKYLEGWDHKRSCETVGKQDGLLGKLEAQVAKLNLFGIVEVFLKLNKTAAVKARQKQQVQESALKALGLQFVAGSEFVSAEPAEFSRD